MAPMMPLGTKLSSCLASALTEWHLCKALGGDSELQAFISQHPVQWKAAGIFARMSCKGLLLSPCYEEVIRPSVSRSLWPEEWDLSLTLPSLTCPLPPPLNTQAKTGEEVLMWKEIDSPGSQKPHTSRGSPMKYLTVKKFLHIKNKMGPAYLDNLGNTFISKSEWQQTIWRLAISKYFLKVVFSWTRRWKPRTHFPSQRTKHCLKAANRRLHFIAGTNAKVDLEFVRFSQRIIRLVIWVSLLFVISSSWFRCSGSQVLTDHIFSRKHGYLAYGGCKANLYAWVLLLTLTMR